MKLSYILFLLALISNSSFSESREAWIANNFSKETSLGNMAFGKNTLLIPVSKTDTNWVLLKGRIDSMEKVYPQSDSKRTVQRLGKIRGKAVAKLLPKWDFYVIGFDFSVVENYKGKFTPNIPGYSEFSLAINSVSKEEITSWEN